MLSGEKTLQAQIFRNFLRKLEQKYDKLAWLKMGTLSVNFQTSLEISIDCGPITCHFCSDFRYESNGMFVLGVGFFSSDKFRLSN